MLVVGDIIKFKKHPKLGERHNYVIEEIVEDVFVFRNLETNNQKRERLGDMTTHGVYVFKKSTSHPQEVKTSPALTPKISIKCHHSKTHEITLSSVTFKQCIICKKDLGDIKAETKHAAKVKEAMLIGPELLEVGNDSNKE